MQHTRDEGDLRVTVSIRIPLKLRARLIKAAYSDGGRGSINAEIVARLDASFATERDEAPPDPEQSHGP